MNNHDQTRLAGQDRLDEDGELLDEDEDYGDVEEKDELSEDGEEEEV